MLSSRSAALVLLGLLSLASAASKFSWSKPNLTELLDIMSQLRDDSDYRIDGNAEQLECIQKYFLEYGWADEEGWGDVISLRDGVFEEMPNFGISAENQAALETVATFLKT